MTIRDKIAEAVEADFYATYRGDKSFNDTADAILSVIAESVVKLEWVGCNNSQTAQTQFGEYLVEFDSEGFGWGFWSPDLDIDYDPCGGNWWPTSDDAKAAAQADYTRRILSGIGLIDPKVTPR